MIHNHYQEYGGIQEHYWLNLYNSQDNIKIDVVSNRDSHPGYASQTLFAEYFYNKITEKLGIK